MLLLISWGGEDKKGKGDDEILTPFKTELGKCVELGNKLYLHLPSHFESVILSAQREPT